jgi:phosphatidylserine decarboxylase
MLFSSLFFLMLFDWSTMFSMLLEHILSLSLFFLRPLSPFARIQEEKSL